MSFLPIKALIISRNYPKSPLTPGGGIYTLFSFGAGGLSIL
jgi:hypothetical protein